MKFESIEFKNLFAYGENVQRVDYSDEGKLVLLKGRSGAGKSAILALPILTLYGKLAKVNKTGIANRINKHGWLRGTLIKGGNRYVIERTFSPNSVKVWRNDEELDFPGMPQAESFIETEIQEIPINAFTNMITISMKKFKSFLSMTPEERRQVVDEVFDVSIINYIATQIKKDLKELSNSINGDNSTIFSLTQTLNNANAELIKIQEKNATPDALEMIEKNNAEIAVRSAKLMEYSEKLKEVGVKQQENGTVFMSKQQEVYQVQQKIKTIDDKIRLFNQSKCPTCSTSFTGDVFDELKKKLNELREQAMVQYQSLSTELKNLSEMAQKIQDVQKKVNDAVMKIRLEINNYQHENLLINEKMKASSEYQAVVNIINQTNSQIDVLKAGVEKKTIKHKDLQKLLVVYSIDGVTKLIINNYLPILNSEIAENLMMLNIPYTLTFDEKFTPHIKDMGVDVPVPTLSDGEQMRIDLVVLVALFKLLKRKYPSINILTIDESISSLDTLTSGAVLQFLTDFAEDYNLNCFIVSHTELLIDNFTEMIEVEKVNGFSQLALTKLI